MRLNDAHEKMHAVTEGLAEPPRFDPKRRRAVLVALSLVTILASFEATVVSTAMPTIIGELEGLPLYSWVFAVYLLTTTVTMPLYGRLADLHGRRLILLVSIVLFLLGAAACAAAQSMPQLILARGLQGIGAGGLLPTALTVTADLYTVRERARVQGLFSTLWGAASLIGPLVGALMTVSLGWRSIFTINLPLGVLAFAIVATNLRESRAPRRDPFDAWGALALGSGVTFLLLSTLQGTAVITLGLRIALVVAGLAGIACFVRLQARDHPLVPLSLFARAETAAPYFGGALLGTTIYGVDTFVPLFVQGARGGTAAAAGAVVTPLVLFWAVCSSFAARLIVPYGFRATARAGTAVIVVGFAALVACARLDAAVPWISAACALVGCGLGFVGLTQVLAIQHTTAERIRGVATSLVPFFRTVGGSLGVGALGGLLSMGLVSRLGAEAETAGRWLARGGHAAEAATAASAGEALRLRLALEDSLLPVFAVLLGLAVLNFYLAGYFPDRADDRPAPVREASAAGHEPRSEPGPFEAAAASPKPGAIPAGSAPGRPAERPREPPASV
jgi:MFS family permease